MQSHQLTEGIHLKDRQYSRAYFINEWSNVAFFIEFCDLFKAKYTDGNMFIWSLTTENRNALFQNCHGLVDFGKCLSNDSHCYILLGKLTRTNWTGIW